MTKQSKKGCVYLVGAGPGDADLITVKGMRLLQSADVVLYDRLAPAELLQHVRDDTETIYVGKVPQKTNGKRQEHINALLIEHAQAGKSVVRLKGGDPFVFGRGGEEALACAEAGVEFELVPGVSSSIAVPAYAGVSVTHRDYNTMFAVFSGHNDPADQHDLADYTALAYIAEHGTLVILMGVMFLDNILAKLMAHGLPSTAPAMMIEQGTTQNQRVVEGAVGSLAQIAAENSIKAPAATVIGKVTELRHKGMQWFDVKNFIHEEAEGEQ
ncbi:MAG: uroporphyrinogen-III C-methyltransferase [Chloroflexota bacterium]